MPKEEPKFETRQKTVDLIGAYDERTRLFNRLRDLSLEDSDRDEILGQYKTAAKLFDKLRADIVK